MAEQPEGAPAAVPGLATERLISKLTLIFGFAASVAGLAVKGYPWAMGLAAGAVLAWLNFRWMRRGLDAFVEISTAQADAPKPRVPVATFFKFLFRYGLIALSVYVIFFYLHIPLVSLLMGLCALGVAAITASLYEVARSAG